MTKTPAPKTRTIPASELRAGMTLATGEGVVALEARFPLLAFRLDGGVDGTGGTLASYRGTERVKVVAR